MPILTPLSKPKLTRQALEQRLSKHIKAKRIDPARELVFVGIRGYYKKTMGDPAKNDRGIYDDALFIVSPHGYFAFNCNTDPARYKPGFGTDDETKGMASLALGVWRVYQFDQHGGTKPHPAICQRAGKVTVFRDGEAGQRYADTGDFGINIHCGGESGVSSIGCQTVPPYQWDEFLDTAKNLAMSMHGGNKWNTAVYPYVLIE
jgi:hypothetical protein